jgi:uncharacterized membrane protein YkvA (DUF1232 family)
MGRLRELVRFLPDCAVMFARLARHPDTSRATRLMLGGTAAYLASPIDLIPDFIPVLGQLDDALLLALVLRLVVRRAGPELVRESWPGSEASLNAVLRLA